MGQTVWSTLYASGPSHFVPNVVAWWHTESYLQLLGLLAERLANTRLSTSSISEESLLMASFISGSMPSAVNTASSCHCQFYSRRVLLMQLVYDVHLYTQTCRREPQLNRDDSAISTSDVISAKKASSEVLHVHCDSKKQDTILLPITSPNVNRSSKFFRCYTQ